MKVTVELKNDLAITGVLHSVDQYLNIKLTATRVVNEAKYPHMASVRNCFVRGSVVRYVLVRRSVVLFVVVCCGAAFLDWPLMPYCCAQVCVCVRASKQAIERVGRFGGGCALDTAVTDARMHNKRKHKTHQAAGRQRRRRDPARRDAERGARRLSSERSGGARPRMMHSSVITPRP